MGIVTLVALLDARPTGPFWGRSWVETVLARSIPLARPIDAAATLSMPRELESSPDEAATDRPAIPSELSGWTIGAVVGNETFVQSRPIVRDKRLDPVEDLLRTPAGCIVAAFGSGGGVKTRSAVHVARYRRWIGVQSGVELPPPLRERLRRDLPDFLARTPNHQADTDVLLLRFLAALHERGGFGQAYAEPDAIRAALREVDAVVDTPQLNLWLSDGKTFAILHRGGTLLSHEPPIEVRPSRRFTVEGVASSAPANLFVWSSDPPPATPIAGAERIAEGILSVRTATPSQLVRD